MVVKWWLSIHCEQEIKYLPRTKAESIAFDLNWPCAIGYVTPSDCPLRMRSESIALTLNWIYDILIMIAKSNWLHCDIMLVT